MAWIGRIICNFITFRKRRHKSALMSPAASPPESRARVDCTDEDSGPPLCYHRWCEYTPAITIYQFFGGCVIGFVGYPFCLASTQAIYSKALGPRPQVRISNWVSEL